MALLLTIVLISIIIFLIFLLFVLYKLGVREGSYKKDLEWQKNLTKIREAIAERQRAGIKGKVTEAFAPFLKGFPFKPSECKFIGDPIDYVVFEGLDERDIKGVHLVEVKKDKSNLSEHQKQIKNIIDSLNSGSVTFREFRLL